SMHSASLRRSATRQTFTPGSGEAEPLGELRSASLSDIAPNPSRPDRRWHGPAAERPSNRATERPSNRGSNNRHRQQWTPADTHGQDVPGWAGCGCWWPSTVAGFGTKRPPGSNPAAPTMKRQVTGVSGDPVRIASARCPISGRPLLPDRGEEGPTGYHDAS